MKLHHHAPWLLAVIPIALGIARLRFDVEVLNLLPADVPAVQGLKIYQQNFANARELIITLRAAEAEAAENAARSIADALRDQSEIIAEVTWQPPWLEHPDQAAALIASLWLNPGAANEALSPAQQASSGVSIGYTGRPAFVAEIAGGMEGDITTSVGGTSLIIAALFWLAHRRWKPMLWLLTLLALILAGTLALGGLIFGIINVVSMGFAAILLGLAVDYAVVHYQEALAQPDLSVPEIRRAIAPSIFWAAATTITAFLVLNFGGLPGLAQLGSLVSLGVGLSALVMIFAFLPPLFPHRRYPKPTVAASGNESKAVEPLDPVRTKQVFAATAILILLSLATLLFGLPPMDATANALRPRHSQAYAALETIKQHLNQKREPLWLIVEGRNESEVARRLDEVEPVLARAVSNHSLAGFTLPTALWPRAEFQAANRLTARTLADRREALRNAAQE